MAGDQVTEDAEAAGQEIKIGDEGVKSASGLLAGMEVTKQISKKGVENKLTSHFFKLSDEQVARRKEESSRPITKTFYNQPLISANPLNTEIKDIFSQGMVLDYGFPIRPKWNKSMSKSDLEKLEEKEFEAWRDRVMHEIQSFADKLTPKIAFEDELPPFEQNIEVWRQLWRVLEKSDVISLLVDCRNPLLLFPRKLFDYITRPRKDGGLGKICILVFMKEDLISEKDIASWKKYFKEKIGLKHVLSFSTKKMDFEGGFVRGSGGVKARRKQISGAMSNKDKDHLAQQSKYIIEYMRKIYFEEKKNREETDEHNDFDDVNEYPSSSESEDDEAKSEDYPTIGMIGTPNAGKSSLINAIIGRKVVSVSRSVGHTKHWQTHLIYKHVDKEYDRKTSRKHKAEVAARKQFLAEHPEVDHQDEDEVLATLCDSPGLVFPIIFHPPQSLVRPRNIYELSAIFPIPQIREPFSAITYLLERVDLFRLYHVNLDSESYGDEISAYGFLGSLADAKGYHLTRAGAPDMHRAGLEVLNDVCDGIVLLNYIPPAAG